MPKIIIDGQTIEARPGIPVLQAAIEAGVSVPHYCYHPGLSIVASCRLCLMEMKMPHPKTQELAWAPKLFPSCQTPVKDNMEVRFASDFVEQNQRHVMEYYLLNHPLDCPVCDKAGECYLQDYTEQHAAASSRMVEDKTKNPKKDIGSHTLLYQDRCVLCTRCVRFCDEVAGTTELMVANRGSRGEIDVFPGRPLENPLQGNVVDLCPVGALLDKDFLFKQRVWLLRETKSISPADSSGQNIFIDHNDGRVWRIRPRLNPDVNTWWISDEARFGWKHVHRDDRLRSPYRRQSGALKPDRWEGLPALLASQFDEADKAGAGAAVACVLSPMLTNEEAWLLATFIRRVAPNATLVLGHVPTAGADQTFPKGFVIRAEKCPNRRGVEQIIAHFAGPSIAFPEFCAAAAEGRFAAAYVTAGYSDAWVTQPIADALARVPFVVVHDLFASPLAERAALLIPSASWVEREGSWTNCNGQTQPFERALPPLEGVKAEGQFFAELANRPGLYRSATVREELSAAIPALAELLIPADAPQHAH